MMSAHKITAGHGYPYLTSRVAAQDAGAIASGGLGAYYAERGESPGRWMGSGLAALAIEAGTGVREEQMIALFGDGRHPNARAIAEQLGSEGVSEDVIAEATALGKPFELNLANNEFLRQVAQFSAEWNRANDQPDCAPVPPYMKARIRTAVAQALFFDLHGREALDAQELSGFVAAQSRLGSRTVAGFDLTFSPVKSVSALWALAAEPVAKQIEAAHAAAVDDTIAWLERAATFTRLGRSGVRQVDTRGLIAAAFVHRSSRAGDPDLHTHVAVSNKVQTPDGRWRALDGRVLLKATVAASERYNTRLEAELRECLGVRFVERTRPGRRPVREIAGVDERLLGKWSSRRAEIDAVRAQLARSFLAEHGRPPTPVEAIELAQQATLSTRARKLEPTSEADQRRRWRAEAERTIGAPRLAALLDGVGAPQLPCQTVGGDALRETAHHVIERVQADRATWQSWHVLAEAQRELRGMDLAVDQLDAAVEHVVALALDEYSIALTRPESVVEPPALQRRDGASVYRVAGAQLYTSRAVLEAEQTVLAAADTFDGQRVTPSAIEIALLESTANGLVLNHGQAGFVRDLASSGARCQLAVAPAGTGKTTALRVLVRAWQEDGGRIVALAPSAAAAQVLKDATGVPADTLAKALRELPRGGALLDQRTLIVVDEAGMASTPDLARLVGYALSAGASIRLVGDDRQLAAIGAGGLLRDLAESRGAVRLTDAVRFADSAEAAAALRIRDGAPGAIDFYVETDRVHAGDEFTAADTAYEAWRADCALGKDSILLAGTRHQVSALNARAHTDRLADSDHPVGPEARLADGSTLSAGDPIITRRNERRLGITATDWVKNGDRWIVHSVGPAGDVTAIHHDTGRHVVLPANYVAQHVGLGYATTIHAAQGSTADTCHTVIDGSETREQLYVALTRGRLANHLHVALPGAADDHAPIRPNTLAPPTAIDLLERVLDGEETQRSATTEMRGLADPYRRLRDAAARYVDAVQLAPVNPAAPVARPAPLPWLPPVPGCNDERWRAYLVARAGQIEHLADVIRQQIIARSQSGTVLRLRDPALSSDRELWRSTHPDQETTQLTQRELFYLRHLAARRQAIRTGHVCNDPQRWRPLVAAVAPNTLASHAYSQLATQLTHAFHAGIDLDRQLPEVLSGDITAALTKLSRLIGEACPTDDGREPIRFPRTVGAMPIEPAPLDLSPDL